MTANSTYKELKEEFVRGSLGTSPWEVLCICSTPAIGLFCYENLLKTIIRDNKDNNNNNDNHHLQSATWLSISVIAAEIVSFWIPMLISQTIWFDTFGKIYLLLQILIGSCIRLWLRRTKQHHRRIASYDIVCETLDCKRTSVSIYRGCLYVLTILAILAVDFHVFPRTLMKTEETGYSLMDLGAASFVVAAGWVSPRARYSPDSSSSTNNHHNHNNYYNHPTTMTKAKSMHGRWGVSWRLVPILGMGWIRLLAHKQVEYPEHVTEYGVHWNFFFTMAFLTMYSTMMMAMTTSPPTLLFPMSMLMIYQWLLSGLVQIWVEKSPRYWEGENHQQHGESNGLIQGTVTIGWDWFVANREGILGCVGYASLFGITEWIAYHYFWHAPQTSSLAPLLRKSRSSKRLWVVSAHVLLIWRIVTHLVAEPSRRTTNGTFVVWVLLVNVLQVAAIHSIVTKNHVTHRPPMILSAISRNGFVLFVIANLLTGAVNLSINTLEVDDRTATVIIAMYMSVMGIIAFVLDRVKGYLPNRRKRETQEQNHHHID